MSVVMRQRWRHLLFLHWAVDPAAVQRALPASLAVETFDGRAWIGLVPFAMEGVRPRFLPPVPGLSSFLELNLRTYVAAPDGRAGVWFFSLDANQPIAVRAARRWFHLPYEHAEMSAAFGGLDGTTRYRSRRRGDTVDADYRYRPRGAEREASPGTLEHFLVERYLLFADTPRGLRAGRVFHEPYRYRDVDLDAWDERVFALDGLEPPGRPPDHAIWSPGVDVRVGALEPPIRTRTGA